MGDAYKKFGYGLFVLKSKNSLFNADFSHEPRQLPDDDGTLYATDKSLKYCIRRYVHDVKGDGLVFFWRRSSKDEKLKPLSLGENYKAIFGKEAKKGDNKSTLAKLLTCWDVRIFGATFAEEGCSVSITGPVQLTYGINKTHLNQKYSSQILSPFRNSEERVVKGEVKERAQRTIGAENKALEAHFVFDYIINPNTLPEHDCLTMNDIAIFKEALCKGASYVNSSAKIGSESEFMLYLESDSNTTLPLMKDLVDLKVVGTKTVIDLARISQMMDMHGIKHMEVYYEPSTVEVLNVPKSAKKFNIHTMTVN